MEQENTDLGLNIDMDMTSSRVIEFLKFTFPEYVRGAALSLDDLSSQPFTGMPASHSATNSQERKLEKAWEQVEHNELRAATVYQTILLCQKSPTYPYQQILLSKFVKKMPDWKIQSIVGYSNSQYYSKRKAALCEFAELLNSKKTKNDCLDIPNLIIEKEEKKPKKKAPEKSKSYDYRTVSGHLSD